jgi:hypothetical protein
VLDRFEGSNPMGIQSGHFRSDNSRTGRCCFYEGSISVDGFMVGNFSCSH